MQRMPLNHEARTTDFPAAHETALPTAALEPIFTPLIVESGFDQHASNCSQPDLISFLTMERNKRKMDELAGHFTTVNITPTEIHCLAYSPFTLFSTTAAPSGNADTQADRKAKKIARSPQP